MRNVLRAALAAAILSSAVQASAAPFPGLAVVDQWAGPDGGWDFSAFDPVHRRLYVARSNGVTAVDVDTGRVTPKLLPADHGHAAIPINGGAEILVTEGASGQATIADAQTGAVRATVKLAKKPDDSMVEPATGLALVMDNAGGGVTLIDTAQAKAVATIPFGGALESPAADGTGRVFINVEDRGEIAVFDIKARKLLAEWKLDGCESPSGLAYAPEAGLLVSACGNKVAKVVSAKTGKVVATLAIGARPDWAGYDADAHAVLIPTGADGVVNVISVAPGATPAVVAKTTGHAGSRSGALDPKTGRLYLPSADFAPNPGRRPAPVAGSFKILVLAPKR